MTNPITAQEWAAALDDRKVRRLEESGREKTRGCALLQTATTPAERAGAWAADLDDGYHGCGMMLRRDTCVTRTCAWCR